MKIRAVSSKLLFIVLIAMAAVGSGQYFLFIDWKTIVLMLGGGFSTLLMGFTFPQMGRAFKHAYAAPGTRQEMRRSAHFWEASGRNFFMLGVFWCMVSFIAFLNTPSKGLVSLADAISLGFLPVFYGVILAVICFIPSYLIHKRINRAAPGPSGEEADGNRRQPMFLRFEHVTGYLVFIGIVLWKLDSPLNPFIHWPSLTIVFGGGMALVMLFGDITTGRPFTLSFAFTGLVGLLMGFTQFLYSLMRSIKGMADAITFAILSCFFAMLALLLIGMPMEDRWMTTEEDFKGLGFSRASWYGLPMIALLLFFFCILLVIIPVGKK